MQPLKGLILSGGKGTRLRPITHTSAKQLVPVANKPVLFYGIEAMAEAGIEEVGIIIAPGDRRRDRSGRRRRLALRRAHHLHRPGRAARASRTRCSPPSRSWAASPFVMYLGDNLLQGGISELVAAFREHGPDALILLTPVPDPENYGVAELAPGRHGEVGRVVRLVEKPAEPRTDLALVGVYMFTAAVHDAARAIEPSRARRARDHRRDPAPRRRGHARRAAHRARLVEGHGAPGGHARGQPADPRQPARAHRGRADRLAGRRPRGDRAGRPAGAHDRARPGDHRRRRAAERLLHRPVHRRSARAARSPARRSSTRSCSPAAPCRTSTGAWSPRCSAAT